jgi:hypothetical protein
MLHHNLPASRKLLQYFAKQRGGWNSAVPQRGNKSGFPLFGYL